VHYYQFNIADYRKDTQHLSPMEHYIYRSLLDWHYLDEKPIPKDTKTILRFLRLGNECLTDVEQVLNDFWTEREDGYIQERVLLEITEYTQRLVSASKAGKASAKARKASSSKAIEQAFNDRSTTVQPTTNQEPLTNNQEKKRGHFVPPSISEVEGYCKERGNAVSPENFIDHYETNGWVRGKTKIKNWKACIRTWERNIDTGTSSQEAIV
jgi:uncharacterized protein YdaU (DUF1376 family)